MRNGYGLEEEDAVTSLGATYTPGSLAFMKQLTCLEGVAFGVAL